MLLKIKKIILRIFIPGAILYSVLCLSIFMLQDNLIFFPEKLSDDYQFQFSQPFEEINIESSTGNSLNCLWFRADNSKGLVIYFHGNAGSLRTWGNVADDFLVNRYDVIIIDYPRYGKSKGKITEANLFSDAQSVYNEMKKKYDEHQLIIYGRSLGSGIAAHLASENNPKKLIMESPYYSMKDLSRHLYPLLPGFLLKYPFRTDLFFRKIKCPVYLIHGSDDEIVYYGSSLKLQSHFKKNDTLITIDGGHHNDLNLFEQYHAGIKSILD